MKIPNRLKEIATLIDKNVDVVDIGCDHGLLDIYLTLENNNNCIASDINEKALSSAISNIEKYELQGKIKTIVSNGFEKIELKENTTVVISGMGTKTILSILNGADISKIDTLIIQSNNDLEILRKEIVEIGFYIEDEIVVKEKNIFYVIIKLKKGTRNYSDFDYYYGPILKQKDYPEYTNHLIMLNEKILNRIPFKYILKKISLNKKLKKLKKIKRT